MRKIFISVPYKLLALIVITLLTISIGFSSMSLWKLQEDFTQFQQDTLVQGQSKLTLHNEMLRSKLRVWLESFTDIIELNEQDDFDALIKGLNAVSYTHLRAHET